MSLRGAADRAVALLIVACATPLIGAVALAILAVDGRPVVYRGVRLGRGKRPFIMYKFRTLARNAESIVGGKLLSSADRLETRLGRFLRETRLDELPQLFNVVRGDMRLFGPRPERPAVYAEQCTAIRDYDKRFLVKPGLVGYSQVFTPHGAPKRLRSRIDNRFIDHDASAVQQLALLSFSAAMTLWRTTRKTSLWSFNLWQRRVLGKYVERRELRRHRQARTRFTVGFNGTARSAWVIDLSERAVCVRLPEQWPDLPMEFELQVECEHGRSSRRIRTARCRGRLIDVRLHGDEYDTVLAYEPISDNSRYFVDQYLLHKSFALRGRIR